MEPLKLLLVSPREEWLVSLNDFLQTSGYHFDIQHVSTKKQALWACYQSKYDILITNHQLPDGAVQDLMRGLGGTVACLVISESTSLPAYSSPPDDQPYIEQSYPSLIHPRAWASALNEVLSKWEKNIIDKIRHRYHDRRLLFDKVAAHCASELYQSSENRIENTLKVLLNILEVSRIYVRRLPSPTSSRSLMLHEVSAPGQPQYQGPFRSKIEVPIRQANGEVSYLGVEDTLHQRQWDQDETDLLKTVASLLDETQEQIRLRIAMYRELGMTA